MTKISYAGYRFPPEIIHQAIWLYLRFTLSFRDVEDLLAERGIAVSYETVRRWVNHFGPMIAAHLRKRRPKPHATWHLDEVYLKMDGRMVYLWRAVDAEGEVPPAARDLGIEHLHERGRWRNNRAENSHQPTRRRESKMQRFKSARSAQKFLSAHRRLQHFQRPTPSHVSSIAPRAPRRGDEHVARGRRIRMKVPTPYRPLALFAWQRDDALRAYSAAMNEIGVAAERHEVGGRLNNRSENSHQPFRRRERAMQRFRSLKTLQKFSSVHAQVHNQFNQERHLVTRQVYKQRRSAALAEWRALAA